MEENKLTIKIETTIIQDGDPVTEMQRKAISDAMKEGIIGGKESGIDYLSRKEAGELISTFPKLRSKSKWDKMEKENKWPQRPAYGNTASV